jgi:hypothetical protein
MLEGRGRSRFWVWGFAVALVGACGGSVVHDDGDAQPLAGAGGSVGGTATSAKPVVGAGGHAGRGTQPMVPDPGKGGAEGGGGNPPQKPNEPTMCEGGARFSDCYYAQDVVCSWQRVMVPEQDATGGLGAALPQDPCEAAEPQFDPSGAPQGGAGGDYPGRNACASYVAVPEQVDPSCDSVTREHRNKECNIDGHCCVLVDVEYCGP